MALVMECIARRSANRAFTLIFLTTAALPGAAFSQAAPLPPTAPALQVVATNATGVDLQSARDTSPSCPTIVPPVASQSIARSVEADDIIRLRDFGKMDASEADPGGFAVSPDGRYLAIQLRQADPVSNSYCQALLIYDLGNVRTAPRIVDMGGDYVRRTITLYGLEGFPTGTPEPLTPKWSKDGKWLAFLKREEGITRLFVTALSEGGTRSISDGRFDVADFAWSDDASQLRYRQRENHAAAIERLQTEGRSGFQFDERFWPLAELTPYPRETPAEVERFVMIGEADTFGGSGSASQQDRMAEEAGRAPTRKGAAVAIIDHRQLAARVGDKNIVCQFKECARVAAAWTVPGADEIVFMRREGFAAARTGIYRWALGENKLTNILTTDDAIRGCDFQLLLVCAREASLQPRDIVEIDLRSGKIHQLIELNPEWIARRLGTVTRLRWTNKYGIETFGDLVLPPDARHDERLPLVVVQYSSRGFLRGGTGDEYPIQAIAAKGFAVLSFDRPLDYRTAMSRADRSVSRRHIANAWTDRASVHDSLMRGIKLAADTHPIDADHIAITGLSDGASTATYALIHADIFSLALISSCCEDPSILETGVGEAYASILRTNEYPLPWEQHKSSWKRVSLAMNASRVCAKIIIQSADREARLATASLRALRQFGRDVTMFIFPDEYHVKWQPVHRQAVFRRTLMELDDWRRLPKARCSR